MADALVKQPKVAFGPDAPPAERKSKGSGKGKSRGKSKGKGFLSLPEGILETTVREAEAGSWKRPKTFDEVEVHVVATLLGSCEPVAQPFFSTHADPDTQPLRFVLGARQALPAGVDLAVATMRKGQISRFTMISEHAYGEQGLLSDDGSEEVPPGATVIFEVELLGWTVRDDLFNNGRAVKSVLLEGPSWQKPRPDDEVRISFVATRHDDDEVLEELTDSEYALGSGKASPPTLALTLERALCLMKRGEKAVVVCAAGQAFSKDVGPVNLEIDLHEICEMNDVSLKKDGSLMKKRLRQGDGHERPKDGHKVSLHLEIVAAGIIDGEQLIECPRTIEFVAGNGEVCDALELLALDLQKHERARLTCSSQAVKHCADRGLQVDLGLSSRQGGVPKTVVFQVELLDFEIGPDVYTLPEEKKLELAESRKEAGNSLFKQQRWALAIERYKRVLEIVNFTEGFSDDLRQSARDIRRSAELNKAACCLRLCEWDLALTACNVVLAEDVNNVKALFRRGSALVGLRDFTAAGVDLRRCLEIEPLNADVSKKLQEALKGQKAEDQKCKGVYSKMCEGLGKMNTPEPEKNDKENADTPIYNQSPAQMIQTLSQKAGQKSKSGVQAKPVAKTDAAGPSEAETRSFDNQTIKPGASVRVESLLSRSDLNGQEGHVVAWDAEQRRWRVKLSTGQGLCLKPSNLTVLSTNASRDRRVQYGPPPPP